MTMATLAIWSLRADGWRLLRFKACDGCGAPIGLWRTVNASLGQWKKGSPRRDGVVHPFNRDSWGGSHMRSCPAIPGRPYTSRSRSRVAPGLSEGPGENRAGSGRDEPVVRMVASQAAEQVTGRAERRPTPPLSVLPKARR